MAVLLVAGPLLLPEYRDPNAGRPDLISAALSLAAVLAMIFGLKQIAQDGLAIAPVLYILGGLTLGVLFVRRQLHLEEPFLDLRLFRAPSFSASLATYGLAILFLFGGFLFLPQYLQLVLGMSPFRAGLWTLPWALSFVVGSMLTPPLVRRIRPGFVMAGGLAFAAVGFALFARIDSTTTFWTFALGSSVFSLGMAPVFTLTTDLIVGSAPPERAGAASAISETSAEFGGALGIAIFGSIGVAVYRSGMAGVLPAGISAEAAEAARATLGGAVTLARDLPGQVGPAVAQAAQAAFIRGLQVCAAISTAGSLALAVLVVLTLRRKRAAPSEAPAQPADAGARPSAEPA
jgi:DHA2 family multidrug resistance protein-like MFS transporter